MSEKRRELEAREGHFWPFVGVACGVYRLCKEKPFAYSCAWRVPSAGLMEGEGEAEDFLLYESQSSVLRRTLYSLVKRFYFA